MTHHKPNFKKELHDAWKIAKLNKTTMKHVADEKGRQVFAYYFIIGAAILGFIGAQLFSPFFKPSLGFGFMMAVIQVVMMILGIYVVSYIAKKLFKGHGRHDHFFRVAGYGALALWMGLLPPLAVIGSIWSLVIIYFALKEIHKLGTGQIIGTLLVSFVIMFVISAILSPAYSKYGYSGKMDYKGIGIDTKGMMKGSDNKMEFGDGTFKVTNEKGETIEWSIPDGR